MYNVECIVEFLPVAAVGSPEAPDGPTLSPTCNSGYALYSPPNSTLHTPDYTIHIHNAHTILQTPHYKLSTTHYTTHTLPHLQ